MIESWHSTVEFELRWMEHSPPGADGRREVVAWIDDNNRDRHSALGRPAPIDREPGLPEAVPRRRHDGSRGPRRGERDAVPADVEAMAFGWPAASQL